MVDLANLSPEQKHLVISEGADYQFVYVNHQPNYANRINQELADKIGEIYNGSVMHARILEIHSPLMELIRETNLDKISIERIAPIIQNLITYDYAMFIDLMTILAAMLESKDIEMKSNHIDFTIECSDQIAALASARDVEAFTEDNNSIMNEDDKSHIVEEEEEECGPGPMSDNLEPPDPQMSPDE